MYSAIVADIEISLCRLQTQICMLRRERKGEKSAAPEGEGPGRVWAVCLWPMCSARVFDVEANGRAAAFMVPGLDSANLFC